MPFEVVSHPLGGPLPLGGRHRFRGPVPSAAHNQDVLQKISHANKHIANLVHVSSIGAGLALGCPQRADGCEDNAVSCSQAVPPGMQQNADAEETGSDGVDAISHPAQRLEMVLSGVASDFHFDCGDGAIGPFKHEVHFVIVIVAQMMEPEVRCR